MKQIPELQNLKNILLFMDLNYLHNQSKLSTRRLLIQISRFLARYGLWVNWFFFCDIDSEYCDDIALILDQR